MPAIERSRTSLRDAVGSWKRAGARIGVVPTMGALHEGHLSLIRAARAATDRVIVTLFVNPRQFDSAADLAAYPRTEEADAVLLDPLGVDILYAPRPEEIYPPGFDTTVTVGGIDAGLEDAFRPGHFDGVATVVAKLLAQTGADVAFFGEKDFQQLLLVQRLARDLDLPVEIVGCPTVREPDGLALSSRNRRLAPDERARAPALHAALTDAARSLGDGADPGPVLQRAREAVAAAGWSSVEYLELRRATDLAPLATATAPARLLAAAWLGDIRLIDNVAVAG